MTKKELLEMVDATISGNGKQEITGQSLNLALTEIINALDTNSSNGGLMIHYLPRDRGSSDPEADYSNMTIQQILDDPNVNFPYRELLQKCINDNIKVFDILMECNNNKTPVPGPIYFDTTFFDGYFNNREISVRGGCAVSWYVYLDPDNPYIGLGSFARGTGSDTASYEMLHSDGLLSN